VKPLGGAAPVPAAPATPVPKVGGCAGKLGAPLTLLGLLLGLLFCWVLVRGTPGKVAIAARAKGPQAATTPRSARREVPLLRYRARISRRDHFNSKGRDLTRIPNIKLQDFLQQDRYNFARLGYRDSGDEEVDRAYQSLAPLFLKPLTNDTPADCFKAVLNGEPLLEISIYQDSIGVRLLQR
jgi:hypothetical protein